MAATHAHRKALGELGESLAADYLIRLGWSILDRNWRCPGGEIDIVALDRTTIVVCEVKTRRSLGYGAPLEAITPQKAARLYRLSAAWRELNQVRPSLIRIDVISVLAPLDAAPQIEHFRGVA